MKLQPPFLYRRLLIIVTPRAKASNAALTCVFQLKPSCVFFQRSRYFDSSFCVLVCSRFRPIRLRSPFLFSTGFGPTTAEECLRSTIHFTSLFIFFCPFFYLRSDLDRQTFLNREFAFSQNLTVPPISWTMRNFLSSLCSHGAQPWHLRCLRLWSIQTRRSFISDESPERRPIITRHGNGELEVKVRLGIGRQISLR